MTKQEALQDPRDAYDWARINGPCDETRQVACQSPCYAYYYAKYIDKSFHKETWQAVQGSDYEQAYVTAVGVPINAVYTPTPGPFPKVDCSDLWTRKFDVVNKTEEDQTEDPNAGKIYNPISGEWSWF